MTLIPTPDLAKALTAVVMDHAERSIERTRTISSAGLEEAILSRLLFLNATAAMSSGGADDEILRLSRKLLDVLARDRGFTSPSPDSCDAYSALSDALRRKGV